MSARFRNRKMKKARIRKSRRSQTTISLPYESLEPRLVLSADFSLVGNVLTLNDFDLTTNQLDVSGPETVMIGDTNNGIAVDDNAIGTGFVMYSVEDVDTRFNAHPGNAAHLIAVRNNGGQWQFNNNSNNAGAPAWMDFTPEASDRLLAELDFDADTVNMLEGTDSVFFGINSGYATGDIVVTANEWNGLPNPGDFGVTGTFFTTSTITFELDSGNWDGTDSAGAVGAGTSTLVVNSMVDRVIVVDSMNQDVNVNFTEVDLTSLGNGMQFTDVNNITQSGAINLNSLGFTGVNSVDLDHGSNDFDTIAGSSIGAIDIGDTNSLIVGIVNGSSGIMTTNADVKLTTGSDLDIDEEVNLGAGSLFLNVAGSVAQTAAITSGGLGLMVANTTRLDNAGNNVDVIAADNGGLTVFTNAKDLVVLNVTVQGMMVSGISVGDNDLKLTVDGNLSINRDIDFSGDAFFSVTGNVLQGLGDGAINVNGLGLMVDGTTTLQNSSNQVIRLSGENGGPTHFTEMTDLLIGSVTVDGMTVTGLTTTDDNVKLTVGGDLLINNTINLGTGDLFLDVDGNVGQETGITANGLGLMVSGTTDLSDESNEINTVAADNIGSSIVRTNVDAAVGSVTVDGMTVTGISAGADFDLGVEGDLNIAEAINIGSNDLMLLAFDLTQSGTGTITADNLSLFAGTAYLDLANDLNSLNGRLNTDGPFAESLFNDIDDLMISELFEGEALISDHDLKLIVGGDLLIDDEVEVNGDLFLDVNGNVAQTASLSADGLGLMVDGTTTLQHANNNVGVVAAENQGTTLFTNRTNLFVDAVTVDGMTVTGLTTNDADAKLSVDGNLAIVQPINVGAGNLFLDVSGSVLQSQPITAAGLGLMVGGTTTLQQFNNDVDTIAAENQDDTFFTDVDGLQVGGVEVDGMAVNGLETNDGDAKLQTGGDLAVNSLINLGAGDLFFMVDGNVTQTAPLTADRFGMMVTGDTTLENPLNNVNVIGEDNLGSTSYVDADEFVAGTVTVAGMTASGFDMDAPIINVQGNMMDIGDGDTDPSLSDGTDFGLVLVGSSEAQEFVIMNNGTSDLVLTGTPNVSIIGDNADDFVVTTQPDSPIGGPGSSSFVITFTPGAEGLREATVVIENNDDDANPYNFAIQGTGTESSNEIEEKFEGPTNVFSDNLNGFQTVSVGSNTVLQSPSETQNAHTTIDPPLATGQTTIESMDISTEVTLSPSNGSLLYSNGYVVFDYVNANNYKVAGIEAKNQLWVIGSVVNGFYTRLAQVFDASLTQTQTRTININVTNNLVTLTPDAPPAGGSAVGPITLSSSNLLTDGNGDFSQIGLGTILAGSQFDCFMVDTDPDGASIDPV